MITDYKILSKIKLLKNSNCYTVPNNYFINLSQQILFKIKNTQNAYQIPNNYFGSLSSSILNKVKQQNESEFYAELQQIAPTLNKISKNNLYQIPENYFNHLTYLNNNNASKVISINKTKWFKYIAAASIVAAIGFATLISNNKVDEKIVVIHNNAVKTNVALGIAAITDDDLNVNVEPEKFSIALYETPQSTLPFLGNLQEEIKLINEEEMELYLKNNSALDNETTILNS